VKRGTTVYRRIAGLQVYKSVLYKVESKNSSAHLIRLCFISVLVAATWSSLDFVVASTCFDIESFVVNTSLVAILLVVDISLFDISLVVVSLVAVLVVHYLTRRGHRSSRCLIYRRHLSCRRHHYLTRLSRTTFSKLLLVAILLVPVGRRFDLFGAISNHLLSLRESFRLAAALAQVAHLETISRLPSAHQRNLVEEFI
jgi:hypothetical protein